MLIDYHLHNHFSPDSEADTFELIRAEKKAGVQEICFTNHAEWFDIARRSGIGVFDEEESVRRFEPHQWELQTIQEKFPEIPLKLGVELTFNESILPKLEVFLSQVDFDFVLGSIHNMEGQVINSSKYADAFFDGRKETPTYEAYFDDVYKLADWGKVDVIAHFDVIKKYGTKFFGPFKPEKYENKIRSILKKMAEKEIGLELNTQAIEKACKQIFPHPIILKWALEEGVRYFTMGSDAHKVMYAAKHLDLALETAKKAGITHISTYTKRQPTLHSIK